jgi:glutamine synthetase
LGKAISELENDDVIMNAMGKNLSKAYIAVKKAELDALEHLTLDEEVAMLLDKY